MKYSIGITIASLATTVLGAYVPSEPWTNLTPDAPAPTGAIIDHTQPFGIQIVLVGSSGIEKRAVDQITDGQVQANSVTLEVPVPTKAPIQQIPDGQIQQQSNAPIQQIPDGQIQHQTLAPIQQIPDGQIQHQTLAPIQQIPDGQIQHQTNGPIQQIPDGQIQHQTDGPIQQIPDGQIQNQTDDPIQTISGVQQIPDGQIQKPTGTAADQIEDGQVQQSGSVDPPADNFPQACGTDTTLSLKLSNGELTDSQGRIGAIVANRQFQFDGPPPQAGTIYAAGWSITDDGYLTLGNSTDFYQCLSGDFYNLYDQNIGAQCAPVKLSIVDLVPC